MNHAAWIRSPGSIGGCCDTGADDHGLHLICTQVTEEFLEFSKAEGNDLSTPAPMFGFPGLKPGDRWCVCISRWVDAYKAGVIAPIVLSATHISALEFISLDELKEHAVEQLD